MKKLIWFLLLIIFACSFPKHKKVSSEGNDIILKDTLYKVKCLDLYPPQKIMEQWKNYPDSILVVFTRDGVFEDSIVVYREGGIINNSGNYQCPAYLFRSAVGDTWIYNSDGKFVYFYESPLPHSDQGHVYNT